MNLHCTSLPAVAEAGAGSTHSAQFVSVIFIKYLSDQSFIILFWSHFFSKDAGAAHGGTNRRREKKGEKPQARHRRQKTHERCQRAACSQIHHRTSSTHSAVPRSSSMTNLFTSTRLTTLYSFTSGYPEVAEQMRLGGHAHWTLQPTSHRIANFKSGLKWVVKLWAEHHWLGVTADCNVHWNGFMSMWHA